MGTQLIPTSEEDLIAVDGENLSRGALVEQMERLIGSKHFRNSKRYPTFLKFVVEQTLAGKPDILKERTLGVQVFARPSDYDTNTDPIVRVTAGEIRKRIAQYYQEPGHERELRIDLPLGSYVPHFYSPGAAVTAPVELATEQTSSASTHELSSPGGEVLPATAPTTPSVVPLRRARRFFLPFAGLLLALLLVTAWFTLRPRTSQPALASIWHSALASPNPVLIVIGVHSLDGQGHEEQIESHASQLDDPPKDMLASMVRSDMVPVSDIVSYSRITDLLTKHSRTYGTMGSADATLEQLRNGPVVLIGALDNLWTLRLTSKLRYRFFARTPNDSEIVDSEHPDNVWHFDNLQRVIVNTHDYAVVASYFDSTIDQPVLVAAGIGKAGTEVAAEFLTSDQDLGSWLGHDKSGAHKNLELVLSTEIIDGKAGPPRVVASATW